MKILPHIIVNVIVNLIVGYKLWVNSLLDYQQGTQIIAFNPTKFSGILGVFIVPFTMGMLLPLLVSLIALLFDKNAFKITLVILFYIMLAFNIFGAVNLR